MKVDVNNKSETISVLTVTADAERLSDIKNRTLKRLGKDLTIKGFRKGKAPEAAIEKDLDDKVLQSEVLEDAVNFLYMLAVNQEKLRPLERPNVQVVKYVPYTSLEFTAEISVIAPPTLGDYKKISKKMPKVSVTAKDVDGVLDNLRSRAAEKNEVDRAAKGTDEVWIDFSGMDKEGKEVAGAKGTDYPLNLGSNTFIPGFEKNLIGVKKGDKKEFSLTFPKDYRQKSLANQKITFTVKVKKVNEVVLPKVDDAFAKKIAPVDGVDSLRKDIDAQLLAQKQKEASDKLKDEIVEELVKKSKISVPELLLNDQIEHIKTELMQNLTYRGLTAKDFYDQQGTTEEKYLENEIKPGAERRVKVGLALAEVAEQEGLEVSEDELNIRIEMLKNQYQDPKMQAQFETEEGKRDLRSRILTEKTVNKLLEYATQ